VLQWLMRWSCQYGSWSDGNNGRDKELGGQGWGGYDSGSDWDIAYAREGEQWVGE
jgi:hypothetical protein